MAFHEMDAQERREFLLGGEPPRTGKLAVVREDGSPWVVPVWYDLDGDDLMFNTGAQTAKGRWIRSDGRVSLCVDDEQPPFAFVSIRGRATVSEDLDEMLEWATRIGARYMGHERSEEFGRRNAVPGELLVRLTPERVVAQAGLTD